MARALTKAQFLHGEPVVITDINEQGVFDGWKEDPDGIREPTAIVRLVSRCGWAEASPTLVKSALNLH